MHGYDRQDNHPDKRTGCLHSSRQKRIDFILVMEMVCELDFRWIDIMDFVVTPAQELLLQGVPDQIIQPAGIRDEGP